MKVRLFLARYAEAQAHLLNVIGGGVTEIGPDPSAFAIAALIEVPWDETNRQHVLKVEIVDEDERSLMVATPGGDQPFEISAQFDVGRPAGIVPGRPFLVPVAVNLQPLPLQPGKRYLVRFKVDDQILDETGLNCRPAPPASRSTQ